MEVEPSELEISPHDLKQLQEQGRGPLVVDCRQPEELLLAALPGVLHIPMRDIPNRLCELDPRRPIVVMCHHGVRSLAVVRWLRQTEGFTDVKSLSGGIDSWAVTVDQDIPRY